MRSAGWLFVCGAVAVGGALGIGNAPAALLDSERLLACAALAEREARLDCYDRLAIEAGATLPAEDVAAEAGDAGQFGLEARHREPQRPDALAVTIVDRRPDRYDRWIVTLDNGQVWRQIDDKHFTWDDAGGYRITRGSFNSFFLESVKHGTRIRVTRMK